MFLHAAILCLSSDNASSEAEKTHQKVFTIPTLLELPYLDPVRFHVVNQMHNFLLGTVKHVMQVLTDENLIKNVI